VRLFVAVNLPAAERNAAWRATEPLREGRLPVRWVREDALHITLKFLGEVDDENASAIGSALAEAVREVRPFEVSLGGVGAFPTLHRPRVVWLGVEPHPALELLANDVERVTGTFGFEPEMRPFQPHITLGRAKRDARPAAFRSFPDLARSVDYGALVAVESVDLMKSTLRPDGAVYSAVRCAALSGGK
jgi:2'-5' RNA ligase